MRFELGPTTHDLRVFLDDGREITSEFRAEDMLLLWEAGSSHQPLTIQLSLRPQHATLIAGLVEVRLLPSLTPKRKLRHRLGAWLQS